jgi:hypothetical protein
MSRPLKVLKWMLGLAVLGVMLSSAGIYAYIHFLKDDAPAPLSFEQRDALPVATVVSATGCASPESKTFESGDADFEVFYLDQKIVGATSVMSGQVQVCGEVIVGGTIDIDATTLTDGTQKADALQGFFQADEFPVVTLTVGANETATAVFSGTETAVRFQGWFRDNKPNVSVEINSP